MNNSHIIRSPPLLDDELEAAIKLEMDSDYAKTAEADKMPHLFSPIKLEDDDDLHLDDSAFTSTIFDNKPFEERCDFFSAEWLKDLNTQMNEETNKRMNEVKNDERIMKRMKERREARLQKKYGYPPKKKYKVPGDDYPGSSKPLSASTPLKPKREYSLISNPPIDIDMLSDSNESVDSVDELAEPALRKLPLSAFSNVPERIRTSSNKAGANSYSWIDSTEVNTPRLGLKEKKAYKKLLEKKLFARPVSDNVKDYIEKYYKPCQYVTKTCPPIKLEDDNKIHLDDFITRLFDNKPTEKRCDFFSAEWLRQVKISSDAETEKCMAWAMSQEHIIQRMKNRKEEKLQAKKRIFEKCKLPGDVFPEPGGGRDDYSG